MKTGKIFTLIVSALLPFILARSAAASGNTYYVAPWGSNHNSGTSPQTPWGTLSYAVSEMQGGDTLLVRGGLYSNQGFTVQAGVGTPSNPVRIMAYPGEAPVLTGSETYDVVAEIQSSAILDGLHIENFTNVSDAIDIWGAYVTIQNCTFKNIPYQFIRLMGADHVTIQNNYFDGNGQTQDLGQGDGIFAGSATNVLVQNNYDTRAGHYFFDAMPLAGTTTANMNIIVRDNTVESFWGGGIAEGTVQNMVFENNRLSHVGEGVAYIKASFELCGPTTIVRNNIIAEEAGWYSDNAMDLSAEDIGGPQDVVHDRVYNNVFYKEGYIAILETQRWERNLTDNKVMNNIMYYDETENATFGSPPSNDYIQFETYHAWPQCPTGSPDCSNYIWTQFPNNNYVQNNIILHADSFGDHPGSARITYTPNTAVTGWSAIPAFSDSVAAVQGSYGTFISGNLEQNPQFVDADAGNFELLPSSPAIAAGTHLAHTTAAGVATTVIPVDDPYSFTDGFGLIPGDVILVGHNAPVSITSVNAAGSALTVAAPVTFLAGDPVDLADHNGSAPDIGAFPFSSSQPALLGVSASVINATSAEVAWTLSSGVTTQVEYGLTTSYGQTSLKNSSPQTNPSITLTGLWPNTTYHYAVICTDAFGGRTVSQDGIFTTFAAPGPVISNVSVSAVSTTGATISWTTDTASTSQVFFSGTDRQHIWNPGYVNSSALNSSGVVSHSVSISGLLPNTLYHFAVQSTDASGATSFSPDARLITAPTATQGPAISNVSVSASAGPVAWFAGPAGQSFAPSGMNCCGYSYAQATISWTTSKPATQNKVLLLPLVGGGNMQSAELDSSTDVPVNGYPGSTTSPSLTIYQLAPNTTYVYILQSTDANGNTTQSPNYEFTTPSTDGNGSGISGIQAQLKNAGIAGSPDALSLGADGSVWSVNTAGNIFTYNSQSQTWITLPGALKQIAAASDGTVWGINSDGLIFHCDPAAQNWTWIPGSLAQLSVGADGDVWGLNAQSMIFHLDPASQSWTWISGSLAQLSVGFDGAVWGVNEQNQVYRFNPGNQHFEQMPGSLTQVAAGADGDIWGLSHDGIYHFDPLTQSWNQVGGTLAQISVGAGNNVWGLGSGGQIYNYDPQTGSWSSLPGILSKISASADGAVWGLDASSHIYQLLQPTQTSHTFHQIPGALVQIATGMDGSTWGINAQGQIYAFDPGTQSWAWIPGWLTRIAVGNGSSVWGLNYQNEIYHYNPSTGSWQNVPGTLQSIAVGGNGDAWGINSAGYIYQFDPKTQRWNWIPGFLQQISVGVDGAVWGVNSSHAIYRYDAEGHQWIQAPGTFAQVAVGSAKSVWGIDLNGSAYRYDSNANSWVAVPGVSLTQIAVGFDGAVWGLNAANQVFQYSSQNQTWQQVSGTLAQISVASDAVVWGLDSSGFIYTYR